MQGIYVNRVDTLIAIDFESRTLFGALDNSDFVIFSDEESMSHGAPLVELLHFHRSTNKLTQVFPDLPGKLGQGVGISPHSVASWRCVEVMDDVYLMKKSGRERERERRKESQGKSTWKNFTVR